MSPSALADGRQVGALTRDEALDALREYARLYGPDFTQAAFNPANARWQHRPDLIERYEAGRPDGRPWPSLNALKSTAPGKSFSRLRELAGFERNKPGGSAQRRAAVPTDDEMPERKVIVRAVRTPDTHAEMLTRELRKATEREQTAKRLLREARTEVKRLRERPVIEARTEVKTVVKRETVKVADPKIERALVKAREQRDDARAAVRAERDQAAALDRDLQRARTTIENLTAERDASHADATEAARLGNQASDRLAAAESRADALAQDLAEARAVADDASEMAMVSGLVRKAEQRVYDAELRAARAERTAAEHGQAMTGELRMLTHAELDELRSRGPAGEDMMAAALKKLAKARKMPGDGKMEAALIDIARAAVTWRDRLL